TAPSRAELPLPAGMMTRMARHQRYRSASTQHVAGPPPPSLDSVHAWRRRGADVAVRRARHDLLIQPVKVARALIPARQVDRDRGDRVLELANDGRRNLGRGATQRYRLDPPVAGKLAQRGGVGGNHRGPGGEGLHHGDRLRFVVAEENEETGP